MYFGRKLKKERGKKGRKKRERKEGAKLNGIKN